MLGIQRVRAARDGFLETRMCLAFPLIHVTIKTRQFSDGSFRSYAYLPETWQLYATIQNLTTLPVIPKGIQTVEDAQLAVAAGAKAIYVSNHGGRQLDTSQSPIDVVLEIYLNAPEVFDQVEVLCDGGVRYGTDVLKLLALGCKAVGMGRP